MATKPAASTSSFGAAAKKKVAARQAQKRTFHFFVKVLDASGNVIPGATLHVDRIMSDARKVVEFLDTPDYANLGLTRIKYEMTSEPRGGDNDSSSDTSL